MAKNIIVIGASAASIAFITKVRSFDKESIITCFSGETVLPYNRCFLADYLSSEVSFENIMLKPEDFFAQHGINLKLNSWVTAIHTDKKTVTVGTKTYSYDYLFIGIGSKPWVPAIGYNPAISGIFTFHHAQDITSLRTYIETNKPIHCAVIGAGINGIECASSLSSLGLSVSLIDQSHHILPLQVDVPLATYIASYIKSKGVNIILNQKVTSMCTNDNKIYGVKLASGSIIYADCVVVATGSTVNSLEIKETPLAMHHGSIIVNERLQTSNPYIFAGGDICLVQDSITKQSVKSMTWSDAMLQGLCAATQLSPHPRTYPGYIGLRDSHFFGKEFYGCGITTQIDSSFQTVIKQTETSITALYLKEDLIKGFVLFGDTSQIGEYKRYYTTQQPFIISS